MGLAEITSVVIVGGGTAGWLAAATLAARRPALSVTLIEAPDIATIGVGEGSWPTLRATLQAIGIPEAQFLAEAHASFKQGSRFDGWVTGDSDDTYLHPFTPPPPGALSAIIAAWQSADPAPSFAVTMTAQAAACAANLAPRQPAMPEYSGALNYGYHLDAAAFARLLAAHATTRLGVRHLHGTVVAVKAAENSDVAELILRDGSRIGGDLFIDCSGSAGVLIAGHCGVRWIDRSAASPNDRALAVQVPVPSGSPIASQTVATAHEAGWLWDIALPTRRGIGSVWSSDFMSDDQAEETLRKYISAHLPDATAANPSPRLLRFSAGHRESFWRGNVIAIGQAAGFIEPLEASAIVMVELALAALAENFPVDRATMAIHARRFNSLFRYRWDRIVDFLKLHYALSQRTEPYWRAQRERSTWSDQLADQLDVWATQPPSAWDLPQVDEVFGPASQAYVLYGMGWPPPAPRAPVQAAEVAKLAEVRQRTRALVAALPTNRYYFDTLSAIAA